MTMQMNFIKIIKEALKTTTKTLMMNPTPINNEVLLITILTLRTKMIEASMRITMSNQSLAVVNQHTRLKHKVKEFL